MKRAERAVLVGIVVAVAVALRWGFVATAWQSNPLRADAGQYARYAHNLVTHGVYSLATDVPPAPDSFRSPGYPLFLAGCRLLGGDGWLALAQGLQVVLGAATAWLAYRLARRALGFLPSLSASALVALSPHLVVAAAYVLTECLTTFVLTAGLALYGASAQRPGRRLAAGLVLGLAALCNETLIVVPLVLAVPLLRRCPARQAGTFLAAALMPFLLWTARNTATELACTGGERVTASISHGSYPGMVFGAAQRVGYPYRDDPAQPAFGASWQGLAEVLGPRLAAAPWRYASWYLLEKPLWLWRWDLVQGVDVYVYEVGNSPYERQPVMAATHWLMKVLHGPVMLLAALAAVVLAWNRRGRHGLAAQSLGLAAVAGTLAYLPVIPEPRYLQPFRPCLFVLAALAVAAIVRALPRRSRRRAPDGVPEAPPAP